MHPCFSVSFSFCLFHFFSFGFHVFAFSKQIQTFVILSIIFQFLSHFFFSAVSFFCCLVLIGVTLLCGLQESIFHNEEDSKTKTSFRALFFSLSSPVFSSFFFAFFMFFRIFLFFLFYSCVFFSCFCFFRFFFLKKMVFHVSVFSLCFSIFDFMLCESIDHIPGSGSHFNTVHFHIHRLVPITKCLNLGTCTNHDLVW